MRTLEELHARATRELFANLTITQYDFVDGREVNRRAASPLPHLESNFRLLAKTIQDQFNHGAQISADAFTAISHAFERMSHQ